MNPDELRQKKKHYLEDAKAIQAKAKEENGGEYTEEETTKIQELLAQAEALNPEIEKAEATEKMNLAVTEAYDAASRPTPRQTEPMAPDGEHATTDFTEAAKDRIEVGYDSLYDDPNGGYGEHGFGQFAIDIREAREDHRAPPKLINWNQAVRSAVGDGLNTFIGTDGGYLIPTAFAALIDRITLEQAVVRPRATRIPMASQRMTFPCVDDTTHASTVFGGVLAYWKSEEAQLTSSKPAFGEVELALHKLTTLAYVTGEMLDWSPLAIDSWLPMKLAQAMAWKEDDGFIGGVGGAGEPAGLLNSACIIEVAKETDQAAATVVFENIVKMDARLWDMSGAGSIIWIANRTIKPQLAAMSISVGTGGMPVFLPANQIEKRPLETLYGYPVVFTEHAEALGTAGDLMLCNVGEYYVGDATGKQRADRSIGLKFDYDQVAYRVVTYSGGTCSWRSAFTPQNGDTLSPVISLAARA